MSGRAASRAAGPWMPDGTWLGPPMSIGRPSVSPLGGAGGGQLTARLHLGADGVVRIRLSVRAAPGVHATAWLRADEWERLAARVSERGQERPA